MQNTCGPIGKLNFPNKEFTIIGAGVAGLLMGYYLKKAGYQVKIYEKLSRAGGKIHTLKTEYGIVETAANAIFTNDDVNELLDDLQIQYQNAAKSLTKFIWKNNKPYKSPLTFTNVFRIIWGLFKKIDRDNLTQMSVYQFFKPMIGHYLAGEIMSAALGGVYAESTKRLHFKSIFKSPISSKRYIGFLFQIISRRKVKSTHKKARSVSFQGGMKTFIAALVNELKDNIIYSTNLSLNLIEKDNAAENIIICTDATSASQLLQKRVQNKSDKISKLLNEIQYNSLYTTTVFTNKEINFLKQGFGVVFPPGEGFKTLGILHNTSIFPARSIHKDIFSFTFITKNEEKNDINNIKDIIHNEIQIIAGEGFQKCITHMETTYWPSAIPIYDLNRYQKIQQLRDQFEISKEDIVLFGNYIDGISIREMVSASKKFVKDLK